jgi:hypothetical protein
MKANREVSEACAEKMVANPDELKSVAVHEEVPKEEIAVNTFGTLKKWYGDRHLAVRRRRKSKKRTQGNGGSPMKLAVAFRGVANCGIPTLRKGQDKDKDVPRT